MNQRRGNHQNTCTKLNLLSYWSFICLRLKYSNCIHPDLFINQLSMCCCILIGQQEVFNQQPYFYWIIQPLLHIDDICLQRGVMFVFFTLGGGRHALLCCGNGKQNSRNLGLYGRANKQNAQWSPRQFGQKKLQKFVESTLGVQVSNSEIFVVVPMDLFFTSMLYQSK